MNDRQFPDHGIPGDAEPHPGVETDEPTVVNDYNEPEGSGHGA